MSDERRQLLEFPCDFPIKMMGRDHAPFHDAALGIIEEHAGPVDRSGVRTAPSRNGRFVSLTVTIRAESQEQLDAIYVALSAHEEVLVAL